MTDSGRCSSEWPQDDDDNGQLDDRTVALAVITFRFAQRLGAGEALKRAPSLGDGRARKREP